MAGMTRIEMKPGPWRITDPAWPVYRPIDMATVRHSDSFSGSGPLAGRVMDAAYGGAPATWMRTASQPELWSVSDGALRLTSGPITVTGFVHALKTLSARVTVSALPASDVWIEPWKGGTPTSYSGQPTLRVRITSAGAVEPLYRTAAGAIAGTGPSATIRAGQTLTMTVTESALSISVDGAVVSTVAHAIPDLTAPHFFGITNGTNAGGLVLDDLVLSSL